MADDIKVKLGLEIGGLFENLDKAVNKLNEVAKTTLRKYYAKLRKNC